MLDSAVLDSAVLDPAVFDPAVLDATTITTTDFGVDCAGKQLIVMCKARRRSLCASEAGRDDYAEWSFAHKEELIAELASRANPNLATDPAWFPQRVLEARAKLAAKSGEVSA